MQSLRDHIGDECVTTVGSNIPGFQFAISKPPVRGESRAVSESEKALELELPANVREVVSRQYAAIVAAHQSVRALADAGAAHWV